jgi:ASC-1-like (ASCH) protein
MYRGTLARIFKDVDYKRVFPEASTFLETVEDIRKLCPKEKEFMASSSKKPFSVRGN